MGSAIRFPVGGSVTVRREPELRKKDDPGGPLLPPRVADNRVAQYPTKPEQLTCKQLAKLLSAP